MFQDKESSLSISRHEGSGRDATLPRSFRPITVLAQTHRTERELPAKLQNVVVDSQLAICRYLSQHKNCLVFVEGLHTDLAPENTAKFRADQRWIKGIFPTGFPASRARLSAAQHHLLYHVQGAELALYLGHVDVLHRTLSPEHSAEINAGVSAARAATPGVPLPLLMEHNDRLRYLVTEYREQLLAAEVQAQLKISSHQGREVVIIIGAGNDLGRVFPLHKGYRLTVFDTLVA